MNDPSTHVSMKNDMQAHFAQLEKLQTFFFDVSQLRRFSTALKWNHYFIDKNISLTRPEKNKKERIRKKRQQLNQKTSKKWNKKEQQN